MTVTELLGIHLLDMSILYDAKPCAVSLHCGLVTGWKHRVRN